MRTCRIGAAFRMQMVPYDVLRTLPKFISDAVDLVPMQPMSVSSSKIREFIQQGEPVNHWLKPAVWEYIEANKLYHDQEGVLRTPED
jgi:nicotinic acid mononucleotide adenylyltransferase